MSGLSSASSSSSSTATAPGTNVAPVSFPGIASGIDYNSIIQKYTDITLQQETPLQNQVTSLNAQQSELLKIQNLIGTYQNTFQAISDPANFSATTPTSSNASAIAASTVAGRVATPGNYVINKATLATATQIVNDPAANGTFSDSTTLINSGASITPNNGSGSSPNGQITINGLQLHYDVNATTLQSFIATNSAALAAVGVTLTYNSATQQVTVSSSRPLTLGSGTDQGNLLAALKIDTAPITQSGGTYTATSTAAIGGINLGSVFNTAQNAGFATPVTSGVFSINGVNFTVNSATNNLNDMLQAINASGAGVIASYDAAADRIVLSAKGDGPQGITLGSSADTSNFLQAAGFLSNATQPNQLSAGANEAVGSAAQIVYTDAAGASHTVYSNSNDVTNVVPGVDLKLQQAVDGVAVPPVTISVAQDSSTLQTAIKNWITAYNAVIDEINTATQAPVVGSTTNASGQSQAAQLSNGGVLFNNQEILDVKNQLVSFVSGFAATGSTAYNSLASIGLTLDSSFTQAAATASNSSVTSTQTGVTEQTFQGTSGRLNDLDVTKLTAALAANSSAVAQMFTGPGSLVTQIGSYLTSIAGLPTQLTNGLAGKVSASSLFSPDGKGILQTETQDQISSLQQQIKLITDQANLQADRMRQEFVNSETQIAQLQSLQSSLGALTSTSTSTSSTK